MARDARYFVDVAVFVAHIFGARIPMHNIRAIAAKSEILVIEDCAQAFASLPLPAILQPDCHPNGSSNGDLTACSDGDVHCGVRHSGTIQLYSFGTIKSSTCLGGAVIVLPSLELKEQMQRLNKSYPIATSAKFAVKVLKVFLLHTVSTPIAFGIVLRSMKILGVDHDKMLTKLLRGFATNKDGSASRSLLNQIRFRPSPPLLRSMERVLSGSIESGSQESDSAVYTSVRVAKSLEAAALIRAQCPNVRVPGLGAALTVPKEKEPSSNGTTPHLHPHAFWIFPGKRWTRLKLYMPFT